MKTGDPLQDSPNQTINLVVIGLLLLGAAGYVPLLAGLIPASEELLDGYGMVLFFLCVLAVVGKVWRSAEDVTDSP